MFSLSFKNSKPKMFPVNHSVNRDYCDMCPTSASYCITINVLHEIMNEYLNYVSQITLSTEMTHTLVNMSGGL